MEEKKQKEESLLKQLFNFAGNYKYLSILSAVLAAVSALVALVPFYDIWRIMQEVIRVKLNFAQTQGIASYGWHAVGYALLGMLLYIAGLMCSHMAAFRVQASMRTIMMEHIMKLPMGFIESEGSGKIRKIVIDSSAATETYLAHNLPDKAVSVATPVGLIALLLVFDWRLGLICLIPAVLGFLFMGSMMGKDMEKSMKEYQNSLETMSAEAVEYVRGIPVVKTFGQTVFSFKRFKDSIDKYEKWTLDYTKRMRKPMAAFTTAVNSTFAFIIAAAYLLGGHGISEKLGLNLFFYIIITPIILMDEATASLDVDNESLIQEAISKLIKNKTVLIIAHRMRTVNGVDKIVVLKDGVVAESGTPEELKEADGIYRHMVELQLQTEQWKY